MRKMIKSENGQAIVLLVLALAGLLAFTALALDGAMLYSDRRTAQNAADAASTAGSGAAGADLRYRQVDQEAWTCTNNGTQAYGYIEEARAKAVVAATDRADSNHYVDGAGGNQVSVTTVCSTGSSLAEKFIDVQVEITTPTRPSMIHMFYRGPLANTVTAVSRVRPGYKSGVFEGSAIVALKEDDKDVIEVGGSKKHQVTHVKGGGVFDNSSHSSAFRQHGGGEIIVDEPGAINVVGGVSIQDSDKVDATINSPVEQIPYPEGVPAIPPPVCNSEAQIQDDTLTPGYWDGKKFPPKDVTQLGDPGNQANIFCVNSADFEVTNGSISGQNVMIYLKDGGVKWDGGEVNLDAPDEGDYAGLLIYVDPQDYEDVEDKGNQTVTLNGNADILTQGTIFAPSADCKINGTSDDVSYKWSQLICYTVKLTGSGTFDVTYDPDENYQQVNPPNMEVKK
jgi:hypothetical protein